MERTFQIPNMCCNNCARVIRHHLHQLEGVKSVRTSVVARRVTIQWQAPTTWTDIERVLDANRYPPGPPFVSA